MTLTIKQCNQNKDKGQEKPETCTAEERECRNTESTNSFITPNALSVLSQLAEGDALFKELKDMVTSAADGGFLIH